MKRLLPITLLALSPVALASFHNMKVVEVFPGTPAAPNAQYVVIQMWSDFQNSVGGRKITVHDSAGVVIATGTYTFVGGVPNGINQDKILIATPQAAAFFNVPFDLEMTSAVIPLTGGKVCFDAAPIDCVAWGNFSGPSNGTVGAVGAPFNPTSAPIPGGGNGGLLPGQAIKRRLDIHVLGSPTVLEPQDDTDNSANNFVFALPAPRNNLAQTGTIPPSTCGNGVLESLEQCDDNNTEGGDACAADCSAAIDDVFADGFEQ